MNNKISLNYQIYADDFAAAGEASSSAKKILKKLGIAPDIIKRAAIAMYEAEMNAFIHANGGWADVEIDEEKIKIIISDKGPGIADVDLAMQEGFSTASDKIRAMGFGAGMGLPNIKRHSDKMEIETEVGRGTKITIVILLNSRCAC